MDVTVNTISQMQFLLSFRAKREILWLFAVSLFCAALMLTACTRASQYAATNPAPNSSQSTSPVSSATEVSETSVSVGTEKNELAASRPPTYPFTPPTLDERIFFADAIAIVRPISVKPSVLTLQHTAGQPDYSPVVQSHYGVIEYLKGDGDSEIVVDAKNIFVTYSSFEHALQTAERESAAQLSELGSGEAVVFIQHMEHNSDFVLDASLKASETNWRQHNAQTGLFSASGEVGDISTTFSAASVSAQDDEHSDDFSIDELRERIDAMEDLLIEGKAIDGWEDCITSRFLQENYRRKQEGLLTFIFDVASFPSGLPADSTIHEFNTTYPRQWFTGDNAHLFHYGANEITTMRPLPAGAYEVYSHFQKLEWIPCDYVPTPNIWGYTFESAEDTLHEAFFDPVDIDGAVGADGDSGVLQPDGFEFEDGETAIERIAWRDGQVEMELSPAADLIGYRMDFIALDGSVALRLDFADAVERVDDDDAATFAWGVCEQSWSDGDLLMLRIAEGMPNDGVNATNDAECLAATPEPGGRPTTPLPSSM